MSQISVIDHRGGVFEVTISFNYGECDRLPFNLLRKYGARIGVIPNGGVRATASFDIRSMNEAANFIEVLDMFGQDGTFQHGSAADPATLALNIPPHEEAPASPANPAVAAISEENETPYEEEAEMAVEVENDDANIEVEEEALADVENATG